MSEPTYYQSGIVVSRALASGETLRIEMDHTGVVDIAGRDLAAEWRDLAPGEGFTVMGRVDAAGELHPIDWDALRIVPVTPMDFDTYTVEDSILLHAHPGEGPAVALQLTGRAALALLRELSIALGYSSCAKSANIGKAVEALLDAE